jgi:hypothetical protein
MPKNIWTTIRNGRSQFKNDPDEQEKNELFNAVLVAIAELSWLRGFNQNDVVDLVVEIIKDTTTIHKWSDVRGILFYLATNLVN